jgi:hypothetical protein
LKEKGMGEMLEGGRRSAGRVEVFNEGEFFWKNKVCH